MRATSVVYLRDCEALLLLFNYTNLSNFEASTSGSADNFRFLCFSASSKVYPFCPFTSSNVRLSITAYGLFEPLYSLFYSSRPALLDLDYPPVVLLGAYLDFLPS